MLDNCPMHAGALMRAWDEGERVPQLTEDGLLCIVIGQTWGTSMKYTDTVPILDKAKPKPKPQESEPVAAGKRGKG